MEHADLTLMTIISARVRELRTGRQWSAERLAHEMNKLGVEWKRGVVTKLETGHRESLSVAELFALALVFEVSPLALLFPSQGGRYEITPGRETSVISVYEWLLGRRAAPEDSPHVGIGEEEGIPAGLPAGLAAEEQRRAAARKVKEQALRARIADLEEGIERLSSPDSPVLQTVSRLHEEAIQKFGQAEQLAEQAADRRFEILLRQLASQSPDAVSALLDGLRRKAVGGDSLQISGPPEG